MSENLSSEPEDGIIGMSYASISNIRSSRQSVYSSKPFGLRVSKSNAVSEIFLGGPNPKQYTVRALFQALVDCTDSFLTFCQGAMEWSPVLKQAYYNISGNILLNGKNVFGSPLYTIIDSGSTTIVAPPAAAEAFWAKVPGSQKMQNAPGYYSYVSI